KIRFGIFPQMIADLSSIALYRLDINMRSASVLGIVGTGAGGFGAVLILAVDGNQWPILATVLAIIIPMVLIVDTISSYLRSKLA
nr:phosphonate ABC transporter, permease protein PhnE [Bacillota bacterium]